MLTVAKYIHLLSLVVWIGSIVFFSFIGAPTIFKTLDRQTAGDVVGAIFPKYFTLWQVCSVLAAITVAYIGLKEGFGVYLKTGLALLVLMGAITAYSSMVNAPAAREVKAEIRAEADESAKAELKKKFAKLHGVSMVLNLMTLVLGLALLYFAMRYLA